MVSDMRILLVEDDQDISESVSLLLKDHGYVVDIASSIAGAEEVLFVESYDCLIVDRGLPDGDGATLATIVRKHNSSVAILLLTAKSTAQDVVGGLDLGADDYLAKPFLPDVLLARIRSLLRRADRPGGSPFLTIGSITINTNSGKVTRNGTPIHVSPKESQLLTYLVIHKGKAIDRQELLDHVWGEDTDRFSNTVDVHIRYLRKKIDTPGTSSIIETVKGKGYMVCGK